jgi:hypothetical protein
LVEFLFAPDRARQTKLSYFFGSIDFARCDAEIDHPAIIHRVAEFVPRKNAKARSLGFKPKATSDQ